MKNKSFAFPESIKGSTAPLHRNISIESGLHRLLLFLPTLPFPAPLKGIGFYERLLRRALQSLARPTIPFIICFSWTTIKRISDAILNAVSGQYPVEDRIVPRNIPEIQHYRTRARARLAR